MQTILATQLNFRDLGGIPAADGRYIKPGLLFRSGDLNSISDEDVMKLEAMKLAMIIDLRAGREIETRPDRRIASVRNNTHIDIHDAAREKAELFLENNDARGLESILVGDYVRMVDHHQADFRRFLHILTSTENLPLVYHCAAGKDRTGMATVYLLTALGVDLQTIREDYMVTNTFIGPLADKIIGKVTQSGLNGEILRPLLEVRTEYLQAALDRIGQRYDGLENYVGQVLMADTLKLREKYLAR